MSNIPEIVGSVLTNEDTQNNLYKDLCQPASQGFGKVLGLVPQAIYAKLLPLRKYILNQEHQFKLTRKLLEKELEDVDAEKIVTPEPYVAVPALQALSYSMDSEELRNLYAKLLANAMNIDMKDKVHPAFVEIIKQMSPLDAQNLRLFLGKNALPIVKYTYTLFSGGTIDIQSNVFLENIQIQDIEQQAVSMSALERLGLITISYSEHIVNDAVYTSYRNTEMFLRLREQVSLMSADSRPRIPTSGQIKECTLKKGCVRITPFGENFLETCVVEVYNFTM